MVPSKHPMEVYVEPHIDGSLWHLMTKNAISTSTYGISSRDGSFCTSNHSSKMLLDVSFCKLLAWLCGKQADREEAGRKEEERENKIKGRK